MVTACQKSVLVHYSVNLTSSKLTWPNRYLATVGRHWHLIHSMTSDLGGHVHGIVKGKAEIPKHNCLTNGSA
ncbi:hypothetical protein T06_812 [Trichinella sp. T6]|nr:hypothetical protein T06_812 [Trichinella sp. T6]